MFGPFYSDRALSSYFLACTFFCPDHYGEKNKQQPYFKKNFTTLYREVVLTSFPSSGFNTTAIVNRQDGNFHICTLCQLKITICLTDQLTNCHVTSYLTNGKAVNLLDQLEMIMIIGSCQRLKIVLVHSIIKYPFLNLTTTI